MYFILYCSHRLTEIFASMGSNQNQSAIFCPLQFRMGILFSNRCLQCINRSVTSSLATDVARIIPFNPHIFPNQIDKTRFKKAVIQKIYLVCLNNPVAFLKQPTADNIPGINTFKQIISVVVVPNTYCFPSQR